MASESGPALRAQERCQRTRPLRQARSRVPHHPDRLRQWPPAPGANAQRARPRPQRIPEQRRSRPSTRRQAPTRSRKGGQPTGQPHMLAPAPAQFWCRFRAHRAMRSPRRPRPTFPRSVQNTPPRTRPTPRQDRPRPLQRHGQPRPPRTSEGATPTRHKPNMDGSQAPDIVRGARPHPVRGSVRPPVPLRLRHSYRAPARVPFLPQPSFPSPAAPPRQHRSERQREVNEKSRDD